jgi:hypothetical protein
MSSPFPELLGANNVPDSFLLQASVLLRLRHCDTMNSPMPGITPWNGLPFSSHVRERTSMTMHWGRCPLVYQLALAIICDLSRIAAAEVAEPLVQGRLAMAQSTKKPGKGQTGSVCVEATGLIWYSYVWEKTYTVTVTQAMLGNTPSWALTHADPPLSARKALWLATKKKDGIVKDSSEFKWELSSASLIPTGHAKWYWVIEFTAKHQAGFFRGRPAFLKLIVLMDGTVIDPELKSVK